MKKLYYLFLMIFASSSAFGEVVSALGEEVVSDFTNMCGTVGFHILHAIPRSFTCPSGKFLPANAVQCYDCPSGYTCTGGTYQFSRTLAQGIAPTNAYVFTNTHNLCASNLAKHYMHAVPKSFTCPSGKFLPANAIQCYDCPPGYTCAGGTYKFSSTAASGIVQSANYTYITTNEHYTCASNFNHFMNGSWTPNTLTLNWNYEDGTGRTEQTTCTYDAPITNLPPMPVRPGYKFMGWRLKASEQL